MGDPPELSIGHLSGLARFEVVTPDLQRVLFVRFVWRWLFLLEFSYQAIGRFSMAT